MHTVPKRLIDDRRMLAIKGLILVPDQTEINRVGQQVIDLTATERGAALGSAGCKNMALGAQS